MLQSAKRVGGGESLALSDAALLYNIADAAMPTDRCDADAWANAFCTEVLPAMDQRQTAMQLNKQWQKDVLNYTGDASRNTLRKAKRVHAHNR